jgi:hypothetical protein
MKKAEVSVPDLVSNLLVASSVIVVVTSVLLGDNLVLVVGRLSREGGIMVQQFIDYLVSLLK